MCGKTFSLKWPKAFCSMHNYVITQLHKPHNSKRPAKKTNWNITHINVMKDLLTFLIITAAQNKNDAYIITLNNEVKFSQHKQLIK